MDREKYDFGGWATRNNLLCSDGRTIRKDAFKDCDGTTVPLVWQHNGLEGPENILGHALLRNMDDGVYCYGKFNDTENGKLAKNLVDHGDITSLSIFANRLKQIGSDVIHGSIKEVSLVLSGANPGAYIETVMSHSDSSEEDAVIYNPMEGFDFDTDPDTVEHSDAKQDDSDAKEGDSGDSNDNSPGDSDLDNKVDKIMASLNEDQIAVVNMLVDAIAGEDIEHSDLNVESVIKSFTDEQMDIIDPLIDALVDQHPELFNDESSDDDGEVQHDDSDDRTVADIFDTLTEEQKTVVFAIYSALLQQQKEEETDMKHNCFDNDTESMENDVLTHDDIADIFKNARRIGSLKEAVLEHGDDVEVTYGVENIDYLFPDAKSVTNTPTFIKRDTGWVSTVMSGVHHSPFSRIKSLFANITEDAARAKGYIKGRFKKEEVFSLLKRVTTPTTVYKKQKLDRDDIVDIVDFDSAAWIKSEMRGMLDEELARAYMIGDGRLPSDDDHIPEDHIRPIWTDSDLFTIHRTVTNGADDSETALNFIDAAIRSRKSYKGSGNPTLFTTEDMLTECLLLKDGVGRDLYDSVSKLATKLRVKDIVTVPVMENATREVTVNGSSKHLKLLGIIVNLKDYTVGADKGGSVNMFEDFDIDFNAEKYLIETRCSGALTEPFSAIALEAEVTNQNSGN